MVTLIRKAGPFSFKCLCLQLGLQEGREEKGRIMILFDNQLSVLCFEWAKIYSYLDFIDPNCKPTGILSNGVKVLIMYKTKKINIACQMKTLLNNYLACARGWVSIATCQIQLHYNYRGCLIA